MQDVLQAIYAYFNSVKTHFSDRLLLVLKLLGADQAVASLLHPTFGIQLVMHVVNALDPHA